MSEEVKKKGFFSKIKEKIKKIKHLDIILVVLFVAIILLVYFSSFASTKKEETPQVDNYFAATKSKFDEYVLNLTNKIEEVVSSVYNAGSSKVILYFEEGITTEIAYTTEEKTLADGTKVVTKSPVLVTNDGKSEPVVLKEILPAPVSVVIVASGAKDTNVKLEILRLVQALFELKSSKIEIFAGN